MSDFEELNIKLSERIKELTCLYNISQVARKHKGSLNDAIHEILSVIPDGWQYPKLVQASLIFDGRLYGENPENKQQLSASFVVNGDQNGTVFVYYINPPVQFVGGIFLKEEQDLIDQIGLEFESIIELHLRMENDKKIAAQLLRTDRLNLLGEITAGIAHELNTPLGNILGFAQLLLHDEKDKTKINDLNKILKSTLHARHIVKKLMFFSCEMPSQFKLTNLNDLISENLELLKIQLNEANIRVVTNFEKELPPYKVDAIQFSQVIFNLVLNAITAMEGGGKLTVHTNLIDSQIQIFVQDTGVGIEKDKLSKIFDPFYTTNLSKGGTGLGLAVSYGIIQAHGGRIEVDSEVGFGTSFKIVLKR